MNVPIIIAFAFVIIFFNKDKPSSRTLLWTGILLTIVGLTLSAIWNSVYFWFFYKHNDVTTGNDGVGFTHATRKQEIVFSAYIALCADCFFAYCLCVVANYQHAYDEKEVSTKAKELEEEDLEKAKKKEEDEAAKKAEEDAKKDKEANDDKNAGD